MCVYIIGDFAIGKSKLAQALGKSTKAVVISATEWAETRFDGSAIEDEVERAMQFQRFMAQELRAQPTACIDHIRRRYDIASGACIITGLRSSFDLLRLLDPTRDVLVYLHHPRGRHGSPHLASYERLFQDVRQLEADGQLAPGHIFELVIAKPEDLVKGAMQLAAEPMVLQALARQARPEEGSTPVHADIKPMRAWAKASVFPSKQEPPVDTWFPCSIFAVSSYRGDVLTLAAVTDQGLMRFDLTSIDLVLKDPATRSKEHDLRLLELASYRSPRVDILVRTFPALDGHVRADFRDGELSLEGTYLFTIDFYTCRDMLHAVALKTGQLAFVPSDRLTLVRDVPPVIPPQAKLATLKMAKPVKQKRPP